MTFIFWKVYRINSIDFIFYSTKWKRQNQLRLEQLRHQATMDKELIPSIDHSSENKMNLFLGNFFFYCIFTICLIAPVSLSCCPTTSLPSFSASNSCTFLSSAAAAAAIFRNVSYAHGCPL